MENNLWNTFSLNNHYQIDSGGVVYVMEYGKYLKIGSTTDINRRYKELVRQANYYSNTNIGKVYFTIIHDKFVENEKKIT